MESETWSCIEGQKEKRRSSVKEKKIGHIKLSTDPQSVAARERRHRISERLKILQGMVPGGTKMDTVSMLDEAIHYVKFLKTQIWLYQAAAASVETTPLPLILPFSLPSSEHPITTTINPTTPAQENDYTSSLSFSFTPPLTFPISTSSLYFQGVVDEDEDDPQQLSYFLPPPFI